MTGPLRYADTGVDIDATDAVKRRMAASVDRGDPRVLNRLGAFAPLVRGAFPGLADPVLVIKTDEPGSKQKLAVELDRLEDLSRDLVNHTVNDVVVMGAEPLYVTDCIVCGRLDDDVVGRLVAGIADACAEQGCVLIGGETSVQPGVVVDGLFVLSATVVGVVDRARVVDGRAIEPGNVILGLASNGLHTNGYTLVRRLLERDPALRDADVDGEPFLDVIMRPHTGYFPVLRQAFGRPGLHGMAHITGGGLRDNLARILPAHVDAVIDLSQVPLTPVFRAIRDAGDIADEEMLRTFNLGVGLVCVCDPAAAETLAGELNEAGTPTRFLGEIVAGQGRVRTLDSLPW